MKELSNEVVIAKIVNTTEHGAIQGKTQTHVVEYYNLDVIISVGYCVKSKNGVIFRKQATGVLKEYLINGYTVNKKRLKYLEKTVKLIDIVSRINTELKGNESRDIIRTIYNTFDGKDLYSTIEEKASNFLYLIIKNHVFIDGNKRIAATLFIYFLNYYNILYKDNKQVIDNNTLVAVTLLIAESNPKEKDILIDLVMNFLTNQL